MRDGQLVERSEHTQHESVKFTILHGQSSWCPKTVTIVTSQITITNIVITKKSEILYYQNVTQKANAVGKMALTDLLDTGLSQTFNL